MIAAKKKIILFILVLIGAFAFSLYYTINLNPENLFFSKARHLSTEWNKKLSENFESKYIIYGGSSSRTGINPQILLEDYGIALVNAGLNAGFGVPALTDLALDYVNPGDTLIVSLEPGFLKNGTLDLELPSTSSGNKFCLKIKGFPYHGKFISLSMGNLPQLLMGNSDHNWSLIAKIVTRTPLYRYNATDNLHSSGWMEVKEKRTLSISKPDISCLRDSLLSKAGKQYLEKLKTWAQKKNVLLMYSIPRAYVHQDFRYINAALLLEISNYMPVLKDACLGAYDVEEEYADTVNHLNTRGAEKATRELARELLSKEFWRKEELQQIVKEGLGKANKDASLKTAF